MQFSIVIPTLDRARDLELTLESLLLCEQKPIQTLIIDQSKTQETKNLTAQDRFSSLNIEYHHTEILSLARARNLAIDLLNTRSEFVAFLDDDVCLEQDFFDQVSAFFIKDPRAKGILANIAMPNRSFSRLKKLGLFLLTAQTEIKKNLVTIGGFNAMPLDFGEEICNVEWTCGCGMIFLRSVFQEGIRFPDLFMKYSLMEDCFMSYELHLRYPDSIFYLPSAKMVHRESPASRIPNRARILQNIIHRYYFIQKFDKSLLAYLRTMLIFMGFDLLQYRDIRVFKWYFEGFSRIYKYGKNIEKSDFNSFIFS